MRKFMATLTQAMDLSTTQLDWVCRHLGHTKQVHLENYWQMSPFLERVQVGKLLLMQDLNVHGNYVGKQLKDVDFTEIIARQSLTTVGRVPDNHQNNDEDEFMNANEECQIPRKKQKSMIGQKPWSAKEEAELHRYLASNFHTKVTPGKSECERAINISRQYKGELCNRHWHKIVKKVSSMLMKLKSYVD